MKQRASNNRTLTLEDVERPALQAMLKSIEDLRQGNPSSWLDAVICADMLEAMRRIPDEMADLIILDPPYNLTRDFGGSFFKARNDQEYEEYLRSWMHTVCQKLNPTGSLYLCGDWRCTAAMQRVLSDELTILNRITWQREKGRGAKSNWKNSMEDIWFAVKDPQHYYFNVEAVMMKRRVLAPYKVNGEPKDWEEGVDGKYRLTYPSNFWDDISVPFWSMHENTDHPTQKPEKLIAKLILASSKEGDVVFDPFMGSGTSCVVASKLGRHYCGIEQNEEYCLWALKRLALAKDDAEIQGYADGVFWERNTNPHG
ncbi:MAG: site-specific DNA-methyltransferase [Bacteroidales bacterium]|nr:site-specific DNA-methyltransferase [Bacteroidales bacterium]